MSLPKIISSAKILELIEVESIKLEDKSVISIAAPPHPALPNRIAIVGNYLTTLGRPAEADLDLLGELQMPIKALNATL